MKNDTLTSGVMTSISSEAHGNIAIGHCFEFIMEQAKA
jgi:hypothetical protein